MLVPAHATLSQMNNFHFDSRKGKTEWGKNGKNQCEKPTSSADFTSFGPSCSTQTYSSCRLKENCCWHSMNNLYSLPSSLNPFCFPFFSLLQASPTKGFFCSQPTTRHRDYVFQCRKAISHQKFMKGATLQPQHSQIKLWICIINVFNIIQSRKKLLSLSCVPFKMPLEILISNSFKWRRKPEGMMPDNLHWEDDIHYWHQILPQDSSVTQHKDKFAVKNLDFSQQLRI